MFSQSTPAPDTGRRRYDLPGASLRGPYKLWIPKTDNRHSESETEGPKPVTSSSRRPHGHHGSTTITAANTAATSASSARTVIATSSAQHAAPPPQKQRTERKPQGYMSEASAHAPVNSSHTSSFSLFKTHAKENKREELPRHTVAPIAVPTRHVTSQAVNVPQKAVPHNGLPPDAAFGSLSTQSSTDPSPRSSTDSGSRNGHVSAPAAEYSEVRKQSRSTWNPYVDARIDRTAAPRRNETAPVQSRRDDKITKDRDDMVTRVTEALGGGSMGKAKAVESALLHHQVHTMRRDDVGYTRRTTSSSASRGAEAHTQAHTQAQAQAQQYTQFPAPPNLRRHKITPQSTPFPSTTHLPDNSSKNSRTSPSSRGNAEPPRPPEPSSKVHSTNSKMHTSSSSKIPHQRTASSPWPFNQALPPEPLIPPVKPQPAQAHSSSWKQPFTRHQMSSTSQKAPVVPPKDSTTHQSSHAPRRQSSRSSLLRGTLPSSHAVTTPPHAASAPVAAPTPPTTIQLKPNPSHATTSPEPHPWSPTTSMSGRPTAGPSGGQQSHSTSQASWFIASKHTEAPTVQPPAQEQTPASSTTKRYPTSSAQSNVTSPPPPTASQRAGTVSNLGSQSHSAPRAAWPTTSKHAEQGYDPRAATEHSSVTDSRYLTTPAVPDVSDQSTGKSVSASLTNPLWSTTSKYPETTGGAPAEPATTHNGRNTVDDSVAAVVPAAGIWTSKYTAESYSSGNETDDMPKESTTVHQKSHIGMTVQAESPPRQTNAPSSAEILDPGTWTSQHATASSPVPTFDVTPTPKSSPKAPSGEASTSMAFNFASATLSAPEPTARGLRHVTANTITQPAATVPGAWTTSNRYGNNVSGSIFDSTKSPNTSPREASGNTRQATLGTTSVPGVWTTKQGSGSGTPSSSESTLKQSPISNTPASSSLKPLASSGTNTGTSTPSSTQISDLINQLSPVTPHSISTRVPISGHPSTPAPVRPVLRATPPPLSISSTSPDTDSLLTPSSLNSPRSTILLPQSQPVSTITAADVPQPPEKETAPRKNGFFDFFRPKPSLKSYEVWTPPTRSENKTRPREEQLKTSAPSPPTPKAPAPVPVPVPPRPKSPKFFSPFKLFSRRHRTVSSASLDVLDGTTPNTVMNSPASSMRADTPGGPPSPPLRDAILATQEWRNKEATELVVSGRKRRPRPGVTFDCPEDVAPVDILPSRLRLSRMRSGDDDDDD